LQASLEALTRVKTLRQIIDGVAPLLDPAAPAPATAAPSGKAVTAAASPAPAPDSPRPASALPRFALEVAELPAPPAPVALPDGVVLITEDEGGLAGPVADALARAGATVVAVARGAEVTERAPGRYAAALEDAAQVDRLVAEVRRQHGPVGGVLHLAPVGGPDVAVASLT